MSTNEYGAHLSRCDRCGSRAKNNGKLPIEGNSSYLFCSKCWNQLHEWVREGRKESDYYDE